MLPQKCEKKSFRGIGFFFFFFPSIGTTKFTANYLIISESFINKRIQQ